MMRLAEPAGRLLERAGNRTPRGMTVHDRTRLTGQLHFLLFLYEANIHTKQKSGPHTN
jgi:hypothetical protein